MFKRIWFCGDIHGSYIPIENFWNRNADNINFNKDTDYIILLGDVGANYYLNERDSRFKHTLESYPFTYFCIRGNHEARVKTCIDKNPGNWYAETVFNNLVYVEKDFPHIKYALDRVAIYNINNCETLIIPGAYSIDKYYRLRQGWAWFEDEQLSFDEMEQGRRLIEQYGCTVDMILSHTCPVWCEPTDLFISGIDQSMVDKTMERYLGEIEYKVNYKYWLWGHYHAFRRYPVEKDERQRIMLSAGEEMLNLEDIINNIRKKY